jgi:UDP-N-acetylmuramate dehydrogenase
MGIFALMDLVIRQQIPLAPYVSFQVGGPARYFCAPNHADQFVPALRFAQEKNLSLFVLGKGTNLVFSDSGYPGLVLYTGDCGRIEWQDAKVTAECGALLLDVVTQSVDRGCAGMQNLAGIPGTVGGGTYINAGAFDQ